MRNLKCAGVCNIGRESVRKSNLQISGQTRVVFGQKKCLGFWFFGWDIRTIHTMFARHFFSRFFVRTDVRTQAVGQRVCARFEWSPHKSREIHSFRLAHSKISEFFAKKNLDQPKMTRSESFGYLYNLFCVKLKILQPSWWFCLKNLLANLNWTFQSFPTNATTCGSDWKFHIYFVLKLKFINDPDGFV